MNRSLILSDHCSAYKTIPLTVNNDALHISKWPRRGFWMFLPRRNDNGEDSMYANYLIWSLHIYTQTDTSPPVPYFTSTKKRKTEKGERSDLLYF